MNTTLRWGILGTGAIARKFAAGLAQSRTGKLVAAGSRGGESLRKFVADFPTRAHAGYEALLADPEVEAVYISTPHPMHAEWAIRAAEAGKHILCEKPIAMNAREAETIVAAARKAGVFLMEAFMYRCHPQTRAILDLIRQGRIGRVRLVHAAFSFRVGWDPASRLLDPALGGGGILDVGCYCASMARLVAGAALGLPFAEPEEIRAVGNIGETGVDEFSVAVLRFPGGMLAQLATGVRVTLENIVRISGEDGHIDVPSPWIVNRGEPGESLLLLHRPGHAVEEVRTHADRTIYAIEADTVAESIAARECPSMSWEDSLGNMRTLDRWRAQIGLRYPQDAQQQGSCNGE